MAFGFGMGFTRNDPFAGGPSLNLQFAGNTVLDPAITFTRALNTATYFNSSGLLTTANANVARFDYDPATLAARGLLIEEARTNLILQSRNMGVSWSTTDVTPNRNQVGLDGVANTACLMTEGSLGTAITNQDGSAVTAGSTITASFVLKRGNTDWVRVGAAGGAGFTNGGEGWFNLSTGAKGTSNNRGTGTTTSTTITNLGGGWYRCTVTTLPDATYTLPKLFLMSATADGSATRVSGATYIVDCAQLEVGAFATSIIPTTTTTLTRNADVASVNTLSPWFNAATGTFLIESTVDSSIPSGQFPIVASVNNGTVSNRMQAFVQTGATDSAGVRIDDGGVSQVNFATGSVAKNTIIKQTFCYATNDFAISTNGSALLTDNAGSVPTVSQLEIGKTSGATALARHIRRITYYPRRLSNAELQAITS